MAAKSILKSSASALIALALGTAALLPSAATAQERDQRGPRGGERVERSVPAPARAQAPAQAPAWQGRAPAANPQPSWNNRPNGGGFGGGYQASQTPRPTNQGNWNRDRERGDRGNGASPIGQPSNGRPAWTYNGAQGSYQGSQAPRPGTTIGTGTGTGTPAWGGRNPTYSDPARGQQGGRDTAWNGRDGRGNDGRGWTDRGNRDRDGNLNRDRDRDRDRDHDWRRNNNSQWGSGWNSNGSRDWRRDRDGWRGNTWRGNGWNNNRWANNDWRGNRWNDNHWGNNGWRGWDRDGWRRNNRYDWSNWRNRHRSSFSLGFYYAPWQGYNYSRFDIGVVIGQPFYAERYWLADPWAYRLPPADGPYRWVRYYNDALLVDIYSGEVVDAVYDIFW